MTCSSSSAEPPLCPSAQCEPGARLIAIVGADGRAGHIRPTLEVDEAFVARATRHGDPRERFRFAQACVESRCEYWTGERCGAIDEAVGWGERTDRIPECEIRPRCRWFAQHGVTACQTCPLVATKLRAPQDPTSA